jgi:hypothetical protein
LQRLAERSSEVSPLLRGGGFFHDRQSCLCYYWRSPASALFVIIAVVFEFLLLIQCRERPETAAAPPSVAKNFRRPIWLAIVTLRLGVIHAMEG